MISNREAYFDMDYKFSKGMAFAYGLTAYDDNEEPIEDPSIGILKPYFKSWGLIEGHGTTFTPIQERKCTQAELHINGYDSTDSPFY